MSLPADRLKGMMADRSGGFQLIFLVSFLLFLAVALAAAVVGLRWRQWLPGAENDASLIHGVKSAVYSFMSYLS